MAIMTLKNVLDGSAGQSSLSAILQSARDSINEDLEKKMHKEDNLSALQTKLNEIYYGSQQQTNVDFIDYYNAKLLKETEATIIDVFNNFDFESNTSGYYTAKSSIYVSTLQGAILEAENTIKSLNDAIQKTEGIADITKIKDVISQVENTIKKGNNILSTAEQNTFTRFGEQQFYKNATLKEVSLIINQLRAFSKVLSTNQKNTPDKVGKAFERSLARTNFLDKASNDVTDAMVDKHMYGSKAEKRGKIGMFGYEINVKALKDKDISKDTHFKEQCGNATITYSYDPSSARMGKMDVQLIFPDISTTPFRVSAKSWTSKGMGDLGETSIDAGLGRITGLSVSEAYKFAVLTPPTDLLDSKVPKYVAVNTAHEMAQLALKADLAMGLSQSASDAGGYANVLVVDNGSSIVVKDLYSIVKNSKLSGYSAGVINGAAVDSYNSMKYLKTYRTSSYLGLITSTLNKMMVTMRLNAKI